ncbi:MAG: hypothetical protein RLZZ568_531, partial [Cyanobacteriota bacterium]
QKFVFVARPQGEAEVDTGGKANSAPSPQSGNGLVAKQTPVILGAIQGQSYQVVSGVTAGERIAVSRILELRDGTAITPASFTQSSP